MTSAVERLVALAGRAVSPLLDAIDELTGDLEALLRRERLLPG
jgi:hypothetical protein